MQIDDFISAYNMPLKERRGSHKKIYWAHIYFGTKGKKGSIMGLSLSSGTTQAHLRGRKFMWLTQGQTLATTWSQENTKGNLSLTSIQKST